MSSTGEQSRPVLLVIQPEASIRQEIEKALSLGGHTAVVGVEGADHALHLLADGINGLAALLVPWPLPDDGIQRLLDGLAILAPKPRPVVLIYGTGYSAHDLHDLAENGANALIATPPRLGEVVRELVALRQTGDSPGHARLLAAAAPRPGHHPSRSARDPGWRDRMVRLATSTRSRTTEFRKNRLVALLTRMDELSGGRVSMSYIETLLLMARNDARQVEALIRADTLNRELIDQCFRLVEERMQFPGGLPAPRAVIVTALEELVEIARVRRRGDRWSANYSDLKAGATDIVMGRLRLESASAEGYRGRLCAWLGVDAHLLDGVDNDRLRRIASRVVKDPDETNALDFARLSLLAHTLKLERTRLAGTQVIEQSSLAALGDLLGDEDDVSRLLACAAEFASDDDVHADDLPPFAEFGALFSKIEGAALAAALEPVALHRLRASVATIAGVPVPVRGAPLPKNVMPPAGREPPPAQGLDKNARLLPRLAEELGLPAKFLAAHDEAGLLARLDRRPLLDVELPRAAVARLRVLALLLSDEFGQRQLILQSSIINCYENRPESLDALGQILARAKAPEAFGALRRALGLPLRRASVAQIGALIETQNPVLTWFVLRDLEDDAPDTPAILRVGLSQLHSHEPGMPTLTPLAVAVERRLERLAGASVEPV